MNSTLDGLKKSTCDRWKIFSALSVELSYTNEYKCHVIETDSELQSFAAYCWAKKCPTIDICVRLTEVSRIVSGADNEFSSNILPYVDDQSGESLTVLKGSNGAIYSRRWDKFSKVEPLRFARCFYCTPLR